MAVDCTDWMPDALDAETKAEFVSAATVTRIDPASGDDVDVVDNHLAAALAWEHYAALGAGGSEQTSPRVESVATGDQSITYGDGGTRQAAAQRRASWHRARAKVRSVRLGGTVQVDPRVAAYDGAVDPDTGVR